MELREYLKGKNRAKFAERVGTSVHYIDQLCVHLRRPSPELALTIQIATEGQVTILELLYPPGAVSTRERELRTKFSTN